MNIELALILSVAANPNDDTPRLVYADWLDENASDSASRSARAEFIRLQIRLERERDHIPRDIIIQLRDRENSLLNTYRAEWEAEIRVAAGGDCKKISFSRGFPYEIVVNRFDRLLASNLLASPSSTFQRLQILNSRDKDVPLMVDHLLYTTIKQLDLSYNYIGDAGADRLADLANIQQLNLAGNSEIGDAGCASLSRLTNLLDLDLSGTQIGDLAAAQLASLIKLHRLNLTSTPITDVGIASIARLPNLESLEIQKTSVTDAGLALIPNSSNLRFLNIRQTAVTDAGIRQIEKLTMLTAIHYKGMDFRRCKFPNVALPHQPGNREDHSSYQQQWTEFIADNEQLLSQHGCRRS